LSNNIGAKNWSSKKMVKLPENIKKFVWLKCVGTLIAICSEN